MLETSSTSLGGQVPSPKSFVSQGEYTGDGVRGIVDVGDTEAEAIRKRHVVNSVILQFISKSMINH